MRLNFLVLCLLVVVEGSCDRKHPPVQTTSNALIFGTFYGFCAGNCVKMYRLDNAALYKDDSVKYTTLNWAYSFQNTRLMAKDKYEIARPLLRDVPTELYAGDEKTYGAPDSHDQGGVYIAIVNGATVRRFKLDFDDTPDQSAALIAFKHKIATVV